MVSAYPNYMSTAQPLTKFLVVQFDAGISDGNELLSARPQQGDERQPIYPDHQLHSRAGNLRILFPYDQKVHRTYCTTRLVLHWIYRIRNSRRNFCFHHRIFPQQQRPIRYLFYHSIYSSCPTRHYCIHNASSNNDLSSELISHSL